MESQPPVWTRTLDTFFWILDVGNSLPYRCINNTSDYTLNSLEKGFALI